MTIQITRELLKAINKIAEAGHGIEIDEKQSGGNNHTNTFITICCRKTGEPNYTKRMIIKHTSSYQGQFSNWKGVSQEFGELCFFDISNVDPLVKIATELA